MSEMNESKSRIHPLVAGAAAAVIIASGVGVAAVTGYLPGSSAEQQPTASAAPASTAAPAKSAHPAPSKQHVASAQPAAKARCVDCGMVTEVKYVEVKGDGSGVGAVAGGVAGGVLGHEIVDGKNQGIATVAGAAVGAFAGHQIEKSVKTKHHYNVAVRMDDGTTKTLAFAEQPAWKSGDRVRVAGAALQRVQ